LLDSQVQQAVWIARSNDFCYNTPYHRGFFLQGCHQGFSQPVCGQHAHRQPGGAAHVRRQDAGGSGSAGRLHRRLRYPRRAGRFQCCRYCPTHLDGIYPKLPVGNAACKERCAFSDPFESVEKRNAQNLVAALRSAMVTVRGSICILDNRCGPLGGSDSAASFKDVRVPGSRRYSTIRILSQHITTGLKREGFTSKYPHFFVGTLRPL